MTTQVYARIVRTRFGWHAWIRQGSTALTGFVIELEEISPRFAFTRRGIERRTSRAIRRIRRELEWSDQGYRLYR